jgi:hypothetical protein
VDAKTGRARPWPFPVGGDQVLALATAGKSVFIGGFDVCTTFDVLGHLLWNAPPAGTSASVNAFAVASGIVYAGGEFDVIGGKSREGLAELNYTLSGSASSWDPRLGARDGSPEVDALVLSGQTLYVGGSFTSVSGVRRYSIAAYNRIARHWTTWAPRSSLLTIYALAVTPEVVYAGGDGGVAAFDRTTGASLRWHPALASTQASPLVHALAVAGSKVYVGDDGGLEVFLLAR